MAESLFNEEDNVMKKTFIITISALVCLAACNKNNPISSDTGNAMNPETQEITLSVSIGSDDDTKVAYSKSGNALKSQWEEGDKLTLITYNCVGEYNSTLATIDNLTLASGKGTTTGAFTGTITGTPGAYYRLIYPAVTQTTSAPYKSVQIPADVPAVNSRGSVVTVSQGAEMVEITLKLHEMLNMMGTNTKHLSNCPMLGYGTITGGVFSAATLRQECSILKMNVTLPDTWKDKTLYYVQVTESGSSPFFMNVTWRLSSGDKMSSPSSTSAWGPNLWVGGGWTIDGDNPAVSVGRVVDAGTEMTIYYPYLCVPAKDFTTGSTVKLYGRDTPTGGSNIEIASKTLTTTVDNDRGRLYTINF